MSLRERHPHGFAYSSSHRLFSVTVSGSDGKLFEKAKQAFERKNYDYAIDLFGRVLEAEPDNKEARHLLRETEIRKNEQEGGGSFLTNWFNWLITWTKTRIQSDPESVADACERYLQRDPENLNLRITLAQALDEMGHTNAGIGELKPLTDRYPDSPALHKQLAKLYKKEGNSHKATTHLKRVRNLDPSDREVESMIKNTMAESTVDEGGWEDAESTQDLIRDEEEAEKLEREKKVLTEPDEIREAIEDEKEIISQNREDLDDNQVYQKWKRIGDWYQKLDSFDDARESYEKALEIQPQDAQLKMKIGDMELARWEKKIRQTKEQLEENPDDEELQEQLEDLKKSRLEKQIEEFRQRADDHPTDMEIKFKLGKFLFRAGKIDEAISNFQKASKDPKIRTDAYNYLGQGFVKKEHFDMAVDQFKKGLEEARTSEEEMRLKYNLAKAYIQNAQWEEAEQSLREILERNYGYRDAADLLDEVREKKEEGAERAEG